MPRPMAPAASHSGASARRDDGVAASHRRPTWTVTMASRMPPPAVRTVASPGARLTPTSTRNGFAGQKAGRHRVGSSWVTKAAPVMTMKANAPTART